MYYLDVNFYRYYIGRADQSVNEQVMIGRIDQQIMVNKIMVDYYLEEKPRICSNGKVRRYMRNYLDIITTVSSALLIRSGLEENLEKKKNFGIILRKRYVAVGAYAFRHFRECDEPSRQARQANYGRWVSDLPEDFPF